MSFRPRIIPFLSRGGVAARSKENREATAARADVVVLVRKLDQHHPVRSIIGGFATFFDVAATPPRLRKGMIRGLKLIAITYRITLFIVCSISSAVFTTLELIS